MPLLYLPFCTTPTAPPLLYPSFCTTPTAQTLLHRSYSTAPSAPLLLHRPFAPPLLHRPFCTVPTLPPLSARPLLYCSFCIAPLYCLSCMAPFCCTPLAKPLLHCPSCTTLPALHPRHTCTASPHPPSRSTPPTQPLLLHLPALPLLFFPQTAATPMFFQQCPSILRADYGFQLEIKRKQEALDADWLILPLPKVGKICANKKEKV